LDAKCEAFYINLDRHPDRRRFVEAELAAAGIVATRIAGIDGVQLPPHLAEYFFPAGRPPALLTPAQIGCDASHMEGMRLLLAGKAEAALVLEDDARLDADLWAVIDAALAALPEGWDLVRLCRASKRAVRPLADLPGGRRLVRYSRVPVGRAGYLVSRSGARKLLVRRRVSAPGDVEIAHPWLLDLDLYGIDPPPIAQERRALPSTIGGSRGAMSRLRRASPDPRRFLFNLRKLGPVWWLRCSANNLFRWMPARPR
jgi:glycosyl transferase family 25